MGTRKELILGTVGDLVLDLLVYDRKEDEDLPRGAIENAVATGQITTADMVGKFRETLMGAL